MELQQKVTLKSKGDDCVVRLKQKGEYDEIVINLNWLTNADLDLGCFYELQSPGTSGGFLSRFMGSGSTNSKGVIDGLQFSNAGGPRDRVTRQGCYSRSPYVWHMGDDRTGSQMKAGESILINPKGYAEFRRIVVYAFIYDGVARWQETDAVVTIRVPGNPEVAVEMGTQSSSSTFAAIAGLEFVGEDQIRVTKYVTFHADHAGCDRKYRWGMRWGAGSK